MGLQQLALKFTTNSIQLANVIIRLPIAAFVGMSVVFANSPAVENSKAIMAALSVGEGN